MLEGAMLVAKLNAALEREACSMEEESTTDEDGA